MEARLSVHVEMPNSSLLKLSGLKSSTDISAVKTRIEQQGGVLPHTYRLTYLDAVPLEDDKTLAELDVVSGATLRAVAWRLWQEVLTAALRGDVKLCIEELRAIGEKGDAQWKAHCGWCTLYTAAHCGHYNLLSSLLSESPTVCVNAQSPCGWTALHAAARMGGWKAVCVLIDHGADVTITDKRGRSASDLAHSSGHKKCEQSLRFCEWNIKKHGIVQQRTLEHNAGRERSAATRRAHQYADSRHSVWLSGPRGPEYLVHTPNPVSVQDVARFRAKQTRLCETAQQQAVKETSLGDAPAGKSGGKKTDSAGSGGKQTEVNRERVVFDYGWFDPLRAQRLVPSTHHILTYSDPSSSHLQPRSLLNPSGYIQPATTPRTPSFHKTVTQLMSSHKQDKHTQAHSLQ